MINDRLIRDSVPYNERERPAYDLLCDAREQLGRAHDKIAEAGWNHGGGHQPHLAGLCPKINELIEQLHDACGACDLGENANAD